MLANKSQIPETEGQTQRSNQRTGERTGPLWRRIRDMQARMLSMEAAISTLRRDVNRIDRKQYREESQTSPAFEPGNGNLKLPAGLFE